MSASGEGKVYRNMGCSNQMPVAQGHHLNANLTLVQGIGQGLRLISLIDIYIASLSAKLVTESHRILYMWPAPQHCGIPQGTNIG